MYTLVALIIFILVILSLGLIVSVFKTKIQFYIAGLDASFSISDIALLWKVSQICELDQPNSLFWSLNSLTKCMAQIQNDAAQDGTDKAIRNQNLMTKLYNYRTKIQNESDNRKGLESTLSLDRGQRLRIILPGKGVFTSTIVNNANQIVINVPKQKDMITVPAEDWVNKVINVYLWRKGDARYVFDTTVTQSGLYLGKSSLFLKHSNNLVRTQKRKAVRADCEIYAKLYIIKKTVVDYTAVETQNGYRCLIQNISENGALIKIGGQGVKNVKIKLQFTIKNMLIIMFGVIKTVEYLPDTNESLLHFECTHIEPAMRNEILSFVYNMMPENEKEVMEALSLTDEDIETEESVDNSDLPPADENVSAENTNAAVTKTEDLQALEPLEEASPDTKKPENEKPKSIEEINVADLPQIKPIEDTDELNLF